MKRSVLILAMALPAALQAQTPSTEEVNALLQSVAAQRDTANNQAAQLNAKLVMLTAELEKAKKEAAACKPVAKDDKNK